MKGRGDRQEALIQAILQTAESGWGSGRAQPAGAGGSVTFHGSAVSHQCRFSDEPCVVAVIFAVNHLVPKPPAEKKM